ncbi:MAG: hypothetical protein A2086_00760 [Spirochaetes bacterium GWD1_27_9]|nr:MAG: hypothetical protein A2086_00760 [Spirochaetes bacterium GWD1_27_9]
MNDGLFLGAFMNKTKILLVEDEYIIATNIQRKIDILGYESEIALHSDEALKLVKYFKPDLILMDINLGNDKINGIELASKIKDISNIPVIYVTAYSDKETFEKAKITEPYGYILKPVEDRELQIVIEIALYKYSIDMKLKEKEQYLLNLVNNIIDAVISIDNNKKIRFINPSSKKILNIINKDVIDNNIDDVLKVSEDTKDKEMIEKLIKNGFIEEPSSNYKTLLVENKKIIVFFNQIILYNERKENIGELFIFNDVTKQIKNRNEILLNKSKLEELTKTLEEKIIERTKELQIERNNLRKRNDIIEDDLIVARTIQQQLLPSKDSVNPCISFLFKPVEKIGGDFYDLISFRERDLIGVFICDVAGHGLSSALIVSAIKSLILESGSHKLVPSDLLLYLNNLLVNRTGERFITAFYGIYNFTNKTFIYSNAAHHMPYCLTKDKIEKLTNDNDSVPLGIFENSTLEEKNLLFKNKAIVFKERTKLLLYTDGVIDIKNTKGEFLGDENFLRILQNLQNYFYISAQDFINNIYSELVEVNEGEDFYDDIALISLDIFTDTGNDIDFQL